MKKEMVKEMVKEITEYIVENILFEGSLSSCERTFASVTWGGCEIIPHGNGYSLEITLLGEGKMPLALRSVYIYKYTDAVYKKEEAQAIANAVNAIVETEMFSITATEIRHAFQIKDAAIEIAREKEEKNTVARITAGTADGFILDELEKISKRTAMPKHHVRFCWHTWKRLCKYNAQRKLAGMDPLKKEADWISFANKRVETIMDRLVEMDGPWASCSWKDFSRNCHKVAERYGASRPIMDLAGRTIGIMVDDTEYRFTAEQMLSLKEQLEDKGLPSEDDRSALIKEAIMLMDEANAAAAEWRAGVYYLDMGDDWFCQVMVYGKDGKQVEEVSEDDYSEFDACYIASVLNRK